VRGRYRGASSPLDRAGEHYASDLTYLNGACADEPNEVYTVDPRSMRDRVHRWSSTRVERKHVSVEIDGWSIGGKNCLPPSYGVRRRMIVSAFRWRANPRWGKRASRLSTQCVRTADTDDIIRKVRRGH